ncbi:TIP41-domain-containing protein [Hypoxylon sp. NC1633]|nr:TIP41-domain-containing protein [Hypoxylon sp. NC1633]
MESHITTAHEPFPRPDQLPQATTTHRQGGFAISTRKQPISKAGAIGRMERALGIPVPEMIFGDNVVAVRHAASGWALEFRAQDALDRVDKHPGRAAMLQVAYARDWSASRDLAAAGAGIRDVVKPYDWSYSTTYRGTVVTAPALPPLGGFETAGAGATAVTTDTAAKGDADGGGATAAEMNAENTEESEESKEKKERNAVAAAPQRFVFAPTTKPIPIELLKRRDPILFFDEVMLYESELDDNGISVLSVKVRVHEHRMLLLARFFLRLDNVVVRIRDTRVYVDFDAEEVTRDYTAKELVFQELKGKLMMRGLVPDAVTAALRDPNQLAELLPTVEHTLESVSLKS